MDRYYGNEWGRKGATISDKTARLEYGLTQDEIYDAIDAGKLQYRPAAMHGNPWLRLLRREAEDLARTLHGERYLPEQQARTELARINRELKQLCAPARRPRGKAGRAPFRARRPRLATAVTLPTPTAIRVQLSSYHSHSGHSSASDGNESCSGFTFLYTMRARSSAAPGRPIRTSSMSSSVSSRHPYNPDSTAIAISAAARRAPRSFRRVRSSMYGWSTSRTRPRPASTDTGPLARRARSLAVISSPNSCSFSTTSSADVISSASAASSGCRRSNSASRTEHSSSDSRRFQGRTSPSCRLVDRGWPTSRKSRRCPLGRSWRR